MARKALVFGSSGQDGQYLRLLLESEGVEVIGIARSEATVIGDVRDYKLVKELTELNKPEFIFHLAANSTTKHSALFENHETISTGSLNILESVRLYSPETKVFLSGSAMQFKNEGFPISEKTEFEASSPYSIARIQSTYAGRYYRKTFGIRVYAGYFFNHDSPLRPEAHVNQKIVRAVQRIAIGSTEILHLGNIEVRKEFNFAGDSVDAVWRLMNQDKVFEVVIGTGKAYSIKDWVARCFEYVGKDWKDHVTLKEDFIPEYSVLVSKPELLFSLGWEPKIDFNNLLHLMMKNL